MTKLGFHVANNNRTGAGELLKAGAALVVCLDQNMIREAHDAGAITAFRTKHVIGEDNPEGIDHESLDNIVARADHWMACIMPVWSLNQGADYYLPNNEWDIGDFDAGDKINAFALECMRVADINGYKLGILNFSTGCPSDDQINGVPCTMEQRLERVLPAMRYAAEHDHAISLHIHTVNHGDLQTTGESIALRYRRLLRFCQSHGFTPKVLITELSNGVGGIEPNSSRYFAAIDWWDKEVQAGEFAQYVVGGALYGFNAAETLTPAVTQIARIMRANSVPIPPTEQEISFAGRCTVAQYQSIAGFVFSQGGSIWRVP